MRWGLGDAHALFIRRLGQETFVSEELCGNPAWLASLIPVSVLFTV